MLSEMIKHHVKEEGKTRRDVPDRRESPTWTSTTSVPRMKLRKAQLETNGNKSPRGPRGVAKNQLDA